VPRSETLAVGKSNAEFLWELNPRACVAVRTSEEEVWPTAYAAIAAEMFADQPAVRAQIYGCFDAEEVDDVVARSKHLFRADWRFVRVAVTRKILKLKVKSHPLLERLLYTIAEKRVVYDGDADDVLGDGGVVTSICMELIDEAKQKNRS
jgi:predicted NAD-dependent protein-ADP-ribosyltransferase YbiA (DUF1768 family)